jgi:hypothetical protein
MEVFTKHIKHPNAIRVAISIMACAVSFQLGKDVEHPAQAQENMNPATWFASPATDLLTGFGIVEQPVEPHLQLSKENQSR